MKRIFDNLRDYFNWFFVNRRKIFQRTRQVIHVMKIFSRYTKSNKDDVVIDKLDALLVQFIKESLQDMGDGDADDAARRITRINRGVLKGITVGVDRSKSKLGFAVSIGK